MQRKDNLLLVYNVIYQFSVLEIDTEFYFLDMQISYMKDESESLVNGIKIYSDGIIKSIENDKNYEGLEYVQKLKNHLFKIQQYLEKL